MPPKGKPAKTGSNRRTNKTKKDDDDQTEWDMGGDDLMQGKQLVKPDDQLELDEKQLKEEFTRILTANNPHAPQNIVRFSFKEGTFKQTSAVEQIAIHFALDGNMLHKDSDEARRQKAGGRAVEPEPEPEKPVEKEPEAEAAKPEGGEEGEEKPAEGEAGGEGGEEKKKEQEEEEEEAADPKKKGALRNQFNYSERASQTFNNPYRERGTVTEPPPRATFSANANQWMIFDAYQADLLKAKIAKEKASKSSTNTFRKEDDKSTKKKLPTMEVSGDNINRVANAANILERMVNQNTFDDISQDFAYFEDASDEFRDQEGTLLPLWKFTYEKSKRQSVTAIKWSPTYPDLFAVGFGSYEFLRQGPGLLLFYTLKNPSFPEHVYPTSSGIMTIDIHPDQPYLVAVGFYDGSVSVYNVLEKTRDPIFCSTAKSGKHTDPVWEVKWQANDLDGNRNFYTASADGRVGCWTLVKDELIFTEMINLKISDMAGASGPDGMQLTMYGCGVSIACHRDIDYLYLVGTEAGKIHKCSKAYSTHFLDTFQAHAMSVNTISWNPFHPDIFITCSADWTVKIWDYNFTTPLFIFDLLSPVRDVAWAPYSSTVFAAVTTSGQCFVYDLNVNKYEALCEQTVVQKKKTKLNKIQFNQKYRIIVVGDERGHCTTLKLSPNLRKQPKRKKGEENLPPDPNFEISKLDKVLAAVREPTKQS